MKTTQSILAVFLMLQVVIAGALFLQQRSNASVRPDGKLLEFDTSFVTRMVIEDAESSVTLSKSDTGWQLPGFSVTVPADKAESVLDNLASAKTGWAVANRKESHEQLEVAEQKFNRKLALYEADKQIAELYVGTSPGLRRSHVRLADDNDVYSVALNSYELSTDRAQWFDTSLLSLADVKSVQLQDHIIETVEDGWKVTTPGGETPEPESSNVDKLVNQLKSLRVTDVVADSDADIPNDSGTEVLVKNDNDEFTYRFYQADDNYLLKRSDQDAVFKINKTDYEAIAAADLSTLVKPPEPAEGDSPNETDQK